MRHERRVIAQEEKNCGFLSKVESRNKMPHVNFYLKHIAP